MEKTNLLNERQVASMLGMSPRTLQGWRVLGKGPGWVKIGALVRYTPEAIEDFLSESSQSISGGAVGNGS